MRAGGVLLLCLSRLHAEPVLAQEFVEASPVEESTPDVFMWLGGGHLFERGPEMPQNLFAFVRRY